MEWFNNQLCISLQDLTSGVMSESNYYKHANENKLTIARPGKGKGNYVLVVVESLPTKFKEKAKEIYPDGGVMQLKKWLKSNYTIDHEARSEFSKFRFSNGSPLPPEKITEYTINASVINSVLALMVSTNALRKATQGGKIQWDDMVEVIIFFKKEFGHTLPESVLRFRKKVAEYSKMGCLSLISGKFQNQNTRKVNYKIERLLLSIDSLPERPFNTTVAELYNSFVCGELDVYDPETGELFNADDFMDKKGEPTVLSDTTVANYLNSPKNRVLRSKLHDNAWDFNNAHRPHHNRTPPVWSFSKVSLDDRDLPRKMSDGNRVKAYYSYDVTSGCVIGYSHNRLKTADLFIDCIKNMFQLIDRQGWNCPAEVEVEHHLVNNFSDGLIKAGVIFPFVRWCNPGNSQEKRAEHLNRSKKYTIEKRSQVGIGRWYARLDANRPKIEKVYDEKNNTYKEATYTYDQLVADDIRAINEHNKQKHPNQKLYPGLTRWDVLCKNQSPNLTPVDKALLYRFIGDKTKTSIRRNMYCTVRGIKYRLPKPEVIERLATNDYVVNAYYMPDNAGNVSEVYLYQNDNFIAVCQVLGLYNEATAEKTEKDELNYQEQSKYVASFDAMVKKEKIQKVKILPKEDAIEEVEVIEVLPPIKDDSNSNITEFDFSDYAQRALADL